MVMHMQIVDLPEGEKITEPGFYRISLDRHHNQPCDGVSVTSGVLRKMELATPADVWAFHVLNPDRWVQEDRTALRLGRAMAAYAEGGMAEVSKHFLVLPADKPRKPTEAQLQAQKEGKATATALKSIGFWEAVALDHRDPLTEAEQKMIEDMGRVLANDPAACAVMGGVPEITMAYRDEVTGLWCLSRPDTVSFNGMMSDYKKMNTMGRPFTHSMVDRRIEQHGYHMQMAFAAEAFERLTGEWPGVVGIVAQCDQPPHHVILREITEECLRIGQFQNRRALSRFHECLTSGYWPGPGDDVGAFQPSDWWWGKMQEEMQQGSAA
jgi:hypothetical protein